MPTMSCSGSSRVTIPEGFRKVIQNIREIAGNFGDDEVYGTLKECNMDPNEAVQKLLNQDSFHEVRRRRDKKKVNNREPSDTRVRGGVQGRGGRGAQGPYPSRFADAVRGRKTSTGKENTYLCMEKGYTSLSLSSAPDVEKVPSISTSSSSSALPNGTTMVDHLMLSQRRTSSLSSVSVITSLEENSATETSRMMAIHSKPIDIKIGSESCESPPISDSLPSTTPLSAPGVYDSASDAVLIPSFDCHSPGAVGPIKREIWSQQTIVETTVNKGASFDASGLEHSSSSVQEPPELSTQSHGMVLSAMSQSSDTSQRMSSSCSAFICSTPSSNYSNLSLQLSTSQKDSPSMEWIPKFAHVTSTQPSGMLSSSDAEPSTMDSVPASSSASDDRTMNLEKKLEELKFSDTQHVIIPHHLQVPESERYGLSFGSFDSSFKLSVVFENGPAYAKNSETPSKSLHESEKIIDEPSSSIHNASPSLHNEDYSDHNASPSVHNVENQSSTEAVVPSVISEMPEYVQSKSEAVLASKDPQNSVVHTAPTYSTFGLIPPLFGSQFSPFASTESPGLDATRLPSFMVQQPFDPSAGYYTQVYRSSTATCDDHFSPLLAPGAVSKYNGNVAIAPPTSESPQETGNSLVLSSAAPTASTTQAASVMQSSIPVPPQPVPISHQPSGLHISHYPPNYLPYSQYFSPFYLPPPILPHFLSNTAFLQQPLTGCIYQPPTAVANSRKYPISQYKPGTNTGNADHTGIPTDYGLYTVGYSPNPATTSGNSTGNENLLVSQYKDNGVYISGQQSNAIYNLPPHGQHMAFAPNQVSLGAFSGVSHSLLQQSQATAAAVETVAPLTNIYQLLQPQLRPQSVQINWANGY